MRMYPFIIKDSFLRNSPWDIWPLGFIAVEQLAPNLKMLRLQLQAQQSRHRCACFMERSRGIDTWRRIKLLPLLD